MSENQKLKRPASHRWAIVLCAFMTIGFVIFLIDVMKGRSGASPVQYLPQIAFFSFFALALFCLLLSGRQKWGYYVTSTLLVMFALRAVYTSLLRVYYLVNGAAVSEPYFHVFARDESFVVQQQKSSVEQVAVLVLTALVLWLCFRFIRGRPSRSYYRFVDDTRGVGYRHGRHENL